MIESLTVSNYRCFSEYRMNHIARVNLLVGRNNSGKTAMLEAIALLASGGDPRILFQICERRQEAEFGRFPAIPDVPLLNFSHFTHSRKLAMGNGFLVSQQPELPGVKFSLNPLQPESDVHSLVVDTKFPSPGCKLNIGAAKNAMFSGSFSDLPMDFDGILLMDPRRLPPPPHLLKSAKPSIYLGPDRLDETTMRSAWNNILANQLEDRVNQLLQIIEPTIQDVVFPAGGGGILVGVKDGRVRYPLGSFGDGVRRMLSLAISLATLSRGGIFMIDEIENGLHYSLMPDLWKFIIRAAMDYDLQIFVTTHSKDCLEGLARLCEETPEFADQVVAHKMDRTLPQSIAFSGSEIITAVEHEIEVR